MEPHDDVVRDAIQQFHLSKRGAFNGSYRDVWGPREKSMGNPWSPTNPDGMVLLRLAENSLMHDQVANFINQKMTVSPSDHLTYSIGPRGSLRLRGALSAYFNEHFHPHTLVEADDLTVTPGLASCIDSIAWTLCDPDDGILIPRPYYNGFTVDITHRSHVQVVGVDYTGVPGYSSLDDLFQPEVNAKALEDAILGAKAQGINIRALLISQPHNPLGRCYPPETLREFLIFCDRHKIHLISDEIYAKSVFLNPSMTDPTPFTSVLAVNDGLLDPLLLHVIQFAWSPHLVQDVWATMLSDQEWLSGFFAQNHELMARNHTIATSFFESHQITYFDSNAAVFIWVDLSCYMLPKSMLDRGDFSKLRSTMSEADAVVCLELESKLAATCLEFGVMISPGSIYASEEFGWYRVTFTLAEAALREGLNRLKRALEHVSRE
ncbi:hypothetical protein E8E14_012017 [Neopestalotiopsis sp. 37M]|nr:hypothetical protein E8E14_012017 [Neopestalotiopsis sp. 37M]